jgi:hypothetical protein
MYWSGRRVDLLPLIEDMVYLMIYIFVCVRERKREREDMGLCSWLRHCATSWKVAGSIPDGVIRIFYCINPSVHIKALG